MFIYLAFYNIGMNNKTSQTNNLSAKEKHQYIHKFVELGHGAGAILEMKLN